MYRYSISLRNTTVLKISTVLNTPLMKLVLTLSIDISKTTFMQREYYFDAPGCD
jgi:uncharacterized membrane protein